MAECGFEKLQSAEALTVVVAFFQRGDSTRVFRIVIREKSGRSYELYQGARFSADKKNLMWKRQG